MLLYRETELPHVNVGLCLCSVHESGFRFPGILNKQYYSERNRYKDSQHHCRTRIYGRTWIWLSCVDDIYEWGKNCLL